jgi:hypothetical protein
MLINYSIDEVVDYLSKDVKTEIGVSSIDGVGVFAIRDIKKGEELFPIWKNKTGIYAIPKNKLHKIPKEVLTLLDKYFINTDDEYKLIRLFNGINLVSHTISYCNSAYETEYTQNISDYGIALRDIKAGEEILEWYTENINLENSK